MKVHLIKSQSIEGYMKKNAGSRKFFSLWLSLLKSADWEAPNDILQTFGAADLLGKGTERVVFNIGGNNFRMICKYHFGLSRVHLYVKWMGSHAAYTQLCYKNEQYYISMY
jgi:mRNA interferase HigB